MTLPPLARARVDRYLAAADREAPGLVEGLYLEGSVALGDFRPGTSDIDAVAVTGRVPEVGDLEGLARAHRRLSGPPALEAVYVTWADLGRDPAEAGPRPTWHDRRFAPDEPSPVTWHTLAHHGVTVRGPAVESLGVWADADVLAAWALANLDSYWGRVLERASRPTSAWGIAALAPYSTVWIVTGVARLHVTLATGEVTSKEGAARYARDAFGPRWHRVTDEALRLRRADRARPAASTLVTGLADFVPGRPDRSRYPTPPARRRDVLAFARMVIADARRRFGGPG